MKYLKVAILSLAFLQGCASLEPAYKVELPNTVSVTIEQSPEKLKPRELARAVIQRKDGKPYACQVILREYPVCLLHEIRHCFEGNWHEGRESEENC